ncbi:hypothetical protein DFJ74DRAFT_51528 [Hyaloraphidium curvatum]|nr:hypothetical protein DFJ74DRAFT_51528 [Hyaloraphidium curvatum]
MALSIGAPRRQGRAVGCCSTVQASLQNGPVRAWRPYYGTVSDNRRGYRLPLRNSAIGLRHLVHTADPLVVQLPRRELLQDFRRHKGAAAGAWRGEGSGVARGADLGRLLRGSHTCDQGRLHPLLGGRNDHADGLRRGFGRHRRSLDRLRRVGPLELDEVGARLGIHRPGLHLCPRRPLDHRLWPLVSHGRRHGRVGKCASDIFFLSM